jgi:hypothetical protein
VWRLLFPGHFRNLRMFDRRCDFHALLLPPDAPSGNRSSGFHSDAVGFGHRNFAYGFRFVRFIRLSDLNKDLRCRISKYLNSVSKNIYLHKPIILLGNFLDSGSLG